MYDLWRRYMAAAEGNGRGEINKSVDPAMEQPVVSAARQTHWDPWTSRRHESARPIGDDALTAFKSLSPGATAPAVDRLQESGTQRSGAIDKARPCPYMRFVPHFGASFPTSSDFHETSVTAFHGRNQEQQADGSARVGSPLPTPII